MCIYKHSDPERGWSLLPGGTAKIQREKGMWPKQPRRLAEQPGAEGCPPQDGWRSQSQHLPSHKPASMTKPRLPVHTVNVLQHIRWVFILVKHISEKDGPVALSTRVTRQMHTKTEPLFWCRPVSSLANSHCDVPAAAHRYLVCQQAIDMLLKGNTQCSEKPP